MKKILFLLVFVLPLFAIADAVEIDGIYYNLVSKINSAEVTSSPNKYTGSVIIPDSVVYEGKKYIVNSIGSTAFDRCNSLSCITIPGSLCSIGKDAFNNCYGLKKVIVEDIAAWCNIKFETGYSNPLVFAKHLYYNESTEVKKLVIPNGVASIGDIAFCGCTGVKSVAIPNSVIEIGRSAFEGCTGLESVIIPDNVATIGYYAFERFTSLTSATLGKGVTVISGNSFEYCSSLSSIIIPDGVTTIESLAFRGCTNLNSVTIPNSVISIGYDAFAGCDCIKKVIVPDITAWCNISFDSMNANPLHNAGLLYVNSSIEIKDLVIPNNVKKIQKYAFSGCSNLTSVTIPYSVTSIDDSAFSGCSGLTSVTIPNSVTTIGNNAFEGCIGLASVAIPNSLNIICNNAFAGCSGLASVIIPNSVTRIGASAFAGCSGLSSVTIPNSVNEIWSNAFSGCENLTTVTIGRGAEYIWSKAFSNCKELSDIVCLAEKVPSTSSDAFLNSYIEYATLHVPALSLEHYSVTAPWNGFGKIVSTNGDLPDPEVKTCAIPTISYANGLLKFDCQTEGAVCHYTLADDDIKTGVGDLVSLVATYNISVYATKEGYEKSEVATATLCWIDAEPMQEGTIEAEDGVTEVKAIPVLIQVENNTINIQGAAEGTDISVYNTDGMKLSSTIANNGTTTLNTHLQSGSTVIVKIGKKAVKVLVE